MWRRSCITGSGVLVASSSESFWTTASEEMLKLLGCIDGYYKKIANGLTEPPAMNGWGFTRLSLGSEFLFDIVLLVF